MVACRYGDVTVVLRPSVAHAVSIVSAFDTGHAVRRSDKGTPGALSSTAFGAFSILSLEVL